mmetsp:Transcript_131567/g.232494  ORF Transcript_131567/g.232494 Transcript_131567/m.232494 type:complete len:542 (+) Transcript_131567:172-1797(+)
MTGSHAWGSPGRDLYSEGDDASELGSNADAQEQSTPTLTHYSVDMGDITLDGFTVWPMDSPQRRWEVREVLDAANKHLHTSSKAEAPAEVRAQASSSPVAGYDDDSSGRSQAAKRDDVSHVMTCEYCGTKCASNSKMCRVCGNLLSNIPPGGLKLPTVCQPEMRAGKRRARMEETGADSPEGSGSAAEAPGSGRAEQGVPAVRNSAGEASSPSRSRGSQSKGRDAVDTAGDVRKGIGLLQRQLAHLAERCTCLQAASSKCRELSDARESSLLAEHARVMRELRTEFQEVDGDDRNGDYTFGTDAMAEARDSESLVALQQYIVALTDGSASKPPSELQSVPPPQHHSISAHVQSPSRSPPLSPGLSEAQHLTVPHIDWSAADGGVTELFKGAYEEECPAMGPPSWFKPPPVALRVEAPAMPSIFSRSDSHHSRHSSLGPAPGQAPAHGIDWLTSSGRSFPVEGCGTLSPRAVPQYLTPPGSARDHFPAPRTPSWPMSGQARHSGDPVQAMLPGMMRFSQLPPDSALRGLHLAPAALAQPMCR